MPYKNIEDKIANDKRYYQENKEKIKADVKKYHDEHKGIPNEKRDAYIKNYNVKRREEHLLLLNTNPEYKAKMRRERRAYEQSDRRRDRVLMRLFGITLAQYNQLKESQSDCCVICEIHYSKLKQALNVDHCHVTGNIRGLLCASCNMALGLLKDDFRLLKKSIEYLQKESPLIKASDLDYSI
jgi:hypothetical protein